METFNQQRRNIRSGPLSPPVCFGCISWDLSPDNVNLV